MRVFCSVLLQTVVEQLNIHELNIHELGPMWRNGQSGELPHVYACYSTRASCWPGRGIALACVACKARGRSIGTPYTCCLLLLLLVVLATLLMLEECTYIGICCMV